VTITWSIGFGRSPEEPFKRRWVVGVERGGAECVEIERCTMQGVVGVEAGEDHVGALGVGACGCREPDARAAADHDDGLSKKRRLAVCGGGCGCGGHGSSDG